MARKKDNNLIFFEEGGTCGVDVDGEPDDGEGDDEKEDVEDVLDFAPLLGILARQHQNEDGTKSCIAFWTFVELFRRQQTVIGGTTLAIQPNLFHCGVIVLKIMELWDDIQKYKGNTMPTYTTEELQQVKEQYVCEWILDVDNVRRNKVLQDLGNV
ncbi:hypothetical protein LR48_Vigan10g172900 [Vigna angularis]|uniref:Ubiquitin-like protease family profile domain-containing protein n=1 Tax=Phaseolus angularis TaxID=3914 RepID=A0A0L9VLP9_PHAAN|nr:hypothetical protein LR48_Vigan10g172900 [Vigna angularis]